MDQFIRVLSLFNLGADKFLYFTFWAILIPFFTSSREDKIKSPVLFFNFSYRLPKLSSSWILISDLLIISPVSTPSLIKKLVSPVFFNPLIIAQLIGAAPLKLGNNEACILIVPIDGIDQISLGNILKATTTIISGS